MSLEVLAPQRPHSAEHFTESRSLWWNDDYLDLVARRFDLARCRTVLDLGAGVGDWTALIAARCYPAAAITAVDREPAWVERLRGRFASRPGFRAVRADVNDLPDLGGPFDLVTCQTLLLHLPDVPGVLRAAKQLLAPGGLLLLAEPNNLSNRLSFGTEAAMLTPSQYGEIAGFWWAFERGREKLGLGCEWIAEALPRLILEAGFAPPQVYGNDRAWPAFPPYDTAEQQLVSAEAAATAEREATESEAAERAQVRACVLAGGLDGRGFESGWALLQRLEAEASKLRASATLSRVGADHLYLFGARNPA